MERLVGAEALARWKIPSKDISPAEFIPIAEESGIISQIGGMGLTRSMHHWKEMVRPGS